MDNKRKISHTSLATFLAVIFSLALLPSFANAQDFGSISGIVNCVTNPIDCLLLFAKGQAANLIGVMGASIDFALKMPVAGVPVVRTSWNIVRGFSNMFFILILIIMAFSTIFSISKYDFRTLIVKFLIAALLINFSLVIGEIIIDWSTSLSNVFLQAIGDVGYRIAQGTNISANFDPGTQFSSSGVLDDATWNNTMQASLDIIMLGITAFSLGVLLFFSIIRIPILWFLLIISPVAWITYILPTTQGINRQWWKEFIGWNVFMPVYLFFIYFGVLFLGQQQQILPGASSPLISGINITFQSIFFYILIGIFLIGGAKIARTASISAGAGGIAAGIWAKGRATARWTGTAPFRGTKYLAGVGWRASGAEGVYKAGQEKFKEKGFGAWERTEGLRGFYGGKEGREEAAARLGEINLPFVGKLAPELAEKQFQKNIKSYEEKYETKYKDLDIDRRTNTFKSMAGNTDLSLQERVAAANKLKDLGENVAGGDLAKLYADYSKRSPAEAVRWIRSQNIDNLNPEDLNALDIEAVDRQLKQKIARIKAKRNLLDPKAYMNKLELFEGKEGELTSFIGDTDKDFIDGLKKPEALQILEALDGKPEAQKKFAMKIAEKGFFAGKYTYKNSQGNDVEKDAEALLSKLVGTGQEGETTGHGSFSSATEAGKFLDLVKKTNLAEALSLKQNKGILKDMYDPTKVLTGKEGLQKALKQELDRAGGEDLTKIMKVEERKDPVTGEEATVVKDERLLEAFLQSLRENRRADQRIKNIFVDPKISNHPLMKALDRPISQLQQESFEESKGKPFEEEIEKAKDLIPLIEKVVENNDMESARISAEEAIRNLDEAKDLIKGIEDIKFITDERKKELKEILALTRRKLEEARKKKPKGPENLDETLPKDDKGPKGPKGGGGGGSSEGSGSSPFGGSRPSTSTWPTPRPQTSPPAESESKVNEASIPFSTKAGTIPSGEIGKPSESVSVPFMITKRMEADLNSLGYTSEQINKLTPADAQKILNAGTQAPKPESKLTQPKPIVADVVPKPVENKDNDEKNAIKRTIENSLRDIRPGGTSTLRVNLARLTNPNKTQEDKDKISAYAEAAKEMGYEFIVQRTDYSLETKEYFAEGFLRKINP